MPKYYILTHRKNGKAHPVNQETYEILKARNHLKSYTVKESDGPVNPNQYIPEEVKSMKKIPKPEMITENTKHPAKAMSGAQQRLEDAKQKENSGK